MPRLDYRVGSEQELVVFVVVVQEERTFALAPEEYWRPDWLENNQENQREQVQRAKVLFFPTGILGLVVDKVLRFDARFQEDPDLCY